MCKVVVVAIKGFIFVFSACAEDVNGKEFSLHLVSFYKVYM